MRTRATSLALVAAAVLLLTPPGQTRVASFRLLGESLGLGRAILAPEVSSHQVRVDGVTGDLYAADRSRPLVVVVPGAVAGARRDPRTVRVATAVARAGRTVFVPELALGAERLDPGDIDRIVRVTAGMDPETAGRPALLGFSFGGSYALVAAADPRIRLRVGLVATFGAYFSLEGEIQAVTTGVSEVAGRRYPWRGDPRGPAVLRRVLLRAGAERRAVGALLANDDPSRVGSLLRGLGRPVLARLEGLSPSVAAEGIAAPVVAMHATEDAAVPPAELLRLSAALPGAETIPVGGFDHVDLATGWVEAVGDLWRASRFGARLLRAG